MPTLYIDMDGVIADFNNTAKQFLNISSNEIINKWSEQDWLKLTKIPHLYRSLRPTELAIPLMTLVKRFQTELKFDCYILTAIPSKNDVPDCIHDKILWIQQYFPYMYVRFGPYGKDKHLHCKPGDILVDDRKDICYNWTQAGGLAIHVDNNNEEVMTKLQQEFDRWSNP